MSHGDPLVSIITVTYNAANFLQRAIRSIELQEYGNLEHVIVDGGSTDGTVDIIREHAEQFRVRWVSEPDSGTADAVNKAMAMAEGDIFVLLPADDEMFPWSVKIAVDTFNANSDVDIVYGDIVRRHAEQDITALGFFPSFHRGYLLRSECLPSTSTYMRRQVYEDIGDFNEDYPMATDYDYWLRATLGREIRHIPEILAIFHKHPGAFTVGDEQLLQRNEEYRVIRRAHGLKWTITTRMARLWDRVTVALFRRISFYRLIRMSDNDDQVLDNRESGNRWSHYLASHRVQRRGGRSGILDLFKPNYTYDVMLEKRSNLESD